MIKYGSKKIYDNIHDYISLAAKAFFRITKIWSSQGKVSLLTYFRPNLISIFPENVFLKNVFFNVFRACENGTLG